MSQEYAELKLLNDVEMSKDQQESPRKYEGSLAYDILTNLPMTMRVFLIVSVLLSFSMVSGQSCWSHSDCGSSSPFCYSYSGSSGYCTDCNYCYYCSYGIDDTCGSTCGTTYYGASCASTPSNQYPVTSPTPAPTPSPEESSYGGSNSYCYEHSDCGSSSPFCYSYSGSSGYCTSCTSCYYCSYGVDGTCGDDCGQTTYYGSSCDGSDDSVDYNGGSSWYGEDYPSAEECDWVGMDQSSYDWELSSNSTRDECIQEAWDNNCESAKWHNATSGGKACYCGYDDEEEAVAQSGSEYQSCFLEEYRSYVNLTWMAHWFATAGIAILILCIGCPIVLCICACVGIYFCCCRSNNNQRPAPAQQPTQIIMVPDQRQSFIQQPQQHQVQMVGQPGVNMQNVPNYSYTSN